MNARELIRRETGLNLTQEVAERAVAERLARLGQSDPQAYLQAIRSDELKALTELVVVPESWMFRDAQAFHAVAAFVRERLTGAPTTLRQRVNILSIPCAGGEEPYSIAMALMDAAIPHTAAQIEAIDLSDVAVERARRGRYTRNAFRGAELGFRDRHFTQDGHEYQISQALRDQVRFSQGNLLAIDTLANAGRYDIVFCRNLLIYFDDATTATAIAKLRLLLADDGMLFAGYAEVPAFRAHGFTPLRIQGAFALHKERRIAFRPKPAAGGSAPAAAVALTRPLAVAPQARVIAPATPAPGAVSENLESENLDTLIERAGQLANQGELAAAAQLCIALLESYPAAADAYFILGMVSECQGDIDAAHHHWRRCVFLKPDHYEALCHLTLLAEQRGDTVGARAFRQRAGRVYGRRADSPTRKQS